MNCRFCSQQLEHEMVDLGFSPPSNSFLTSEQLNQPEVYYPLRIMVCSKCFLVQIDEFAKHNEIFNSDYVYFSSYSASWLAHAKEYVGMMMNRFAFKKDSLIIEIASNDGYLLQYFHERSIPVLGIEPTANTAAVARKKGIDSVVDFFGVRLARELISQHKKADLLIGNNVLAHVPDINDFVGGLKILLKNDGIITMEFPHILQLIKLNQFDTIYHEHFSYLSAFTVKKIFENAGLELFDIEEIPTHGGSLRIFARHKDTGNDISPNVVKLLEKEEKFGLQKLETYLSYQQKADKVKNDFTAFLIEAKRNHHKVCAYGAAAKGNTLLNYAGIKKDLLPMVADASPHKQNKFLPGVHIPVVSEEEIKSSRPKYVVILPWNLKDEISKQLSYVKNWGGRFVVAVPELQIFE